MTTDGLLDTRSAAAGESTNPARDGQQQSRRTDVGGIGADAPAIPETVDTESLKRSIERELKRQASAGAGGSIGPTTGSGPVGFDTTL